MNWSVEYLPEAEKDYSKLDGSQRIVVRKAIAKLQQNPLPANEGGYGKPLGNHNNSQLSGLLKVKIKSAGLRIVYGLKRIEHRIVIVVIGIRADSEVYTIASNRKKILKL